MTRKRTGLSGVVPAEWPRPTGWARPERLELGVDSLPGVAATRRSAGRVSHAVFGRAVVVRDARGDPRSHDAALAGTRASFTTAAAEWLRCVEHDRRRKATTVRGYRILLDVHVLPEFGEQLLTDITTEQIERWVWGIDCGPHG